MIDILELVVYTLKEGYVSPPGKVSVSPEIPGLNGCITLFIASTS